jgi:hypothetical protein
MKDVVVNLLSFECLWVLWESVIDAEQVVAEAGNGEELLEHGVHVANAAQVAKANALLAC